MNKKTFIEELKKINIDITKEQLEKLDKFYNLLVDWNNKINLTTITKEEDVYLKHFYDSLTLIKAIDLTKDLKICDVGSGAGFPGIVLKIVFPNLNITLIDSLQKRVNYLNDIIKKLNLINIKALHARMEEFSKENEEQFDIITARAVGNTKLLTEISIKSLKINGKLIFMKANLMNELDNTIYLFNNLGCILKEVVKFKLPIEESNRSLVIIEKIKKTPSKYPRRLDKIKKSL